MHGVPPSPAGRYDRELWIMNETGWSWSELMATPQNVVEEFVVRRSANNEWESKKAEMKSKTSRK